MAESPTMQEERELLENEREFVAQEVERLRESLRVEPELELDEGDPTYVLREQNLALLRDFEDRLQEIDRAIQALEEGVYGRCENCGQRIDPERLRIFPETTLCVTCKTEVERRRRGL